SSAAPLSNPKYRAFGTERRSAWAARRRSAWIASIGALALAAANSPDVYHRPSSTGSSSRSSPVARYRSTRFPVCQSSSSPNPIRTAARAAGLHPQTLRDYERRRLLQPSRTDGGMRLYSDADIAKAKRLSELTAEGTPLVAARRILRLEGLLRLMFARIRTLED